MQLKLGRSRSSECSSIGRDGVNRQKAESASMMKATVMTIH